MAKAFQKLTRPEMRKAAPGKPIMEHGISFERLCNGDGVFKVNVMVDGQRIHRVIGRESDGTTRTQAEDFIEQVRQDAKHERLALPKGRKVALRFRHAAEKYLSRLGEEEGKDLAMKRRRLELHVIPFFGEMPLSKMNTLDIERYKRHRRDELSLRGGDRVSAGAKRQPPRPHRQAQKTTVATINRELAVVSHMLNKAVEWGWLQSRSVRVRRFKEGEGRITYLTVEQVKRVVDRGKADANPQIHLFILIGLETAMRTTEILSIRKENVDLARMSIFIPSAKAGPREQPITTRLGDTLRARIAALPEDTPWLFPSTHARQGHTRDVRKAYCRVISAAGLDPRVVVRHTLRHTAITHLVQSGVDLPTVKRISGHKTLAMVERYAHANGSHIRAAMDLLQRRYEEAA